MPKKLTLSIVIPAYNEEHHLKACLQAIALQTEMPDEVIVVDNNSRDDTIKIARSFSFVKVVREHQQGITPARDKGFDGAKSFIIGRIDADTVLPADWVERVKAFYKNPAHNNIALTGGCYFYNVRLPKVNQWITSQFVFRINRVLIGHYILWGSNMALPAPVWKAVRGKTCHRNDIHEDLDLAIHLNHLGYRINYQATLIVGARMARVFENRGALWPTLMLWPRTLRIHGKKTWVFGWLGAVFLYLCVPVVLITAYIGRLFTGGSK